MNYIKEKADILSGKDRQSNPKCFALSTSTKSVELFMNGNIKNK
jgi:hypothetical protein